MTFRSWPRRSMLFVPGNQAGMVQAAPYLGADSVILDLEDSVAHAEKDAARLLTAGALRALKFGATERVVRINSLSTQHAAQDIQQIISAGVDTLLIPKASPADLAAAARILDEIGAQASDTALIPIIETALGIEHVFACARASRVTAVFLGAEDLTLDTGMERTRDGAEIYFARCMVATAAAAAGIQAIDTPFTDVDDEEGLVNDTRTARRLGFSGKACIHPLQVEVVHRELAPTAAAIRWAERVIEADRDARARGLGAVALDGQMIDAPIVRRAQMIRDKARVSDRSGKDGGERGDQ